MSPAVSPMGVALFADSKQGNEKALFQSLSVVDWDFRGALTNGATHAFHPYPARFIPQIPAALIEAFTSPGDVIYDPFVGCGTTCVEANLAGRNAIGNDVNALAVLISSVKTNLPPDCEEPNILATVPRAVQLIELSDELDINAVPAPSQEWFEYSAKRELSAIKRAIDELQNATARDFCLVALSAIIVTVSKQDSDTRYVRVAKKLLPMDVVRRYELQLQKMLRIMHHSRNALTGGTATICVADSREEGIFADNSADFAVTSPPYPNAYDYHLYHKHRLLWLGIDPSELKRREIGAHAHYSRKNGMDENDFARDMEKVFRASGRILKSGAYFAVVIGDSILRGRKISNSEIIKKAASTSGFKAAHQFHRQLDWRKKSFNPSHGNINREDIVILRNEK